ncbi:MAG: hypothetical protein L3J51_09305 [Cocleimonas sp.]|nr:hypothetical protein [Cocleimonas sp.]
MSLPLTILLVDNGSIKATATLQLRKIAAQLSKRTKLKIHPVSLQHADVIPTDSLGGVKASVFTSFLTGQLQQGQRGFIVLPLFFGNSRALTKLIPDVQAELEKEFGVFDLKISDTLFPLPQSDTRLVDIIFDNIQIVAQESLFSKHTPPLLHDVLEFPKHHVKVGGCFDSAQQNCASLKNIVLVDHGSPSPQITAVRNRVAKEVQAKLGQEIKLEQAVMERREGKEYDFNGELLEGWLIAKAEQGEVSAIVSLLFSLPGRHAGEGGDIESICESVMQRYPDFKIGICPLVGEHPLLLDILADRLNSIQES